MKWIKAHVEWLLGMLLAVFATVWLLAGEAQSIRNDVDANKADIATNQADIESVRGKSDECRDTINRVLVDLRGVTVRLDEAVKRLERMGSL